MTLNWDVGASVGEQGIVRRISISQGEYAVAEDPDVVITTVLGSCVAACIRDPKLGIGGMNHFVLPGSSTRALANGDQSRYGIYLMRLLLDDLLARGANPRRMEAKVYGGASPCNSYYNVGEQNIAFAMRFLAEKRIQVVESKCGGLTGCKLDYWPVSGQVSHVPLLRSTSLKIPLVTFKRVLPF